MAPTPASRDRPGPIYLGIFFTFAPVGFLLGLMPAQPWGWGMSLLSAVFGGSLSVFWSWTFQSRRHWLIPVLIVGSASSGWWLFWPMARLGLSDVGLSLDPFARRVLLMSLSIASLAVGFTILIRVMAGNERRAARLQTELDLAARIHRSLVPPIDLRTPSLHVFGRSEASSEMGGDLIDVVVREGSADLYLADISGHGVRAGVLMAMVKSALRTSLLEGARGEAPSLAAVASSLNRVVEEVSEPDMFATFACLRVADDRRIDYSLAGHWPILHIRCGTGEIAELGGESMPLGVDRSENFDSRSLVAERGDLFVLLTDGLIEVADRSGSVFGLERVRSIVRDRADRPLPEVYGAVLDAVRAFGGQGDDQTLLLARIV